MSEIDIEKILTASLQRNIDFVKFAEAKHAVLLTLASAWCLGITTLLSQHAEYPPLVAYCLQYSRALFVAALFISTWSFLPKRKLEIFHRTPPKEKNLLFFGHLASFDLEELRTALQERYKPDNAEAYFNDVSDQIRINSKIADRKFLLFNRAASALMLGVAILALPTALNILHWLCSAGR